MHVLSCSVCQGAMREINESGVMIDACTQRRGVWLDRGELENLSEVMASPRAGGFQTGTTSDRHAERRRDDDDDEESARGWGSRQSRFLDFFD